jgi:UDP-N-acetyl-D-glucosamine dehydrogenase
MTKNLAVVGLGYVGLPLAVQAAEKGYRVYGVDKNKQLLTKISARQSPYVNDQRFASALENISSKTFTVSDSYDSLQQADVVIICVPTPTNNNVPDLSLVQSAVESVAVHARSGQLIVLESTVNPGVTRDLIAPILERVSGLTIGEDIFLAHCPERIDPGNSQWFVGNLNRVVGGITEACTAKAVEFYETIIDARIIALGSSEEAEFTKSWENSHRNVMIALANEAAIICDALGMDVSNVMRGLQSKVDQFGLSLAQPGIGPGGHCIPEDIHYVIQKAHSAGVDTNFLASAARLNDGMPAYAVESLEKILQADGRSLQDMKIGLAGLSYKPNVGDMRRSPAIEVAKILHGKTTLLVHDPYIEDSIIQDEVANVLIASGIEELLEKVDVLFVASAHAAYLEYFSAKKLKKHNVRYVLDGRNCLDRDAIVAAGIVYRGIGQ